MPPYRCGRAPPRMPWAAWVVRAREVEAFENNAMRLNDPLLGEDIAAREAETRRMQDNDLGVPYTPSEPFTPDE